MAAEISAALPKKQSPVLCVSHLLLVPPEIRDCIYSWFFDTSQAPGEPGFGDESKYPTPSSGSGSVTRKWDTILIRDALPKYSLLPILQVCQQIRLEFQQFLVRPQKCKANANIEAEAAPAPRGLRYVLDVRAYYRSLYPIWRVLSLPPEAPYNLIEELRVNYLSKDFTSRNRGRFYFTGGPGYDCGPLFYLCNYFFFHGPQWYYLPAVSSSGGFNNEKPGPGLKIGRCKPHIKRLVFDICFEYNLEEQQELNQLKADSAAGKEGADEELRRALDGLHSQESMALEFGVRRWFSLLVAGGYFDGYVEKVVLLFNGNPLQERYPRFYSDCSDKSENTHEYIVPNGFQKPPGWKPSEEYEDYGFKWGPREDFQKSPSVQADS
ncbi:hypothetical protein ABW20_dc0102864 [Dactylellina cionopaga]|nr:hypothetical protein ABW20_dc0102864 [Dactylellina cionopaga]